MIEQMNELRVSATRKRVRVNTNVRFSIQSVGHTIWLIIWCYRRLCKVLWHWDDMWLVFLFLFFFF